MRCGLKTETVMEDEHEKTHRTLVGRRNAACRLYNAATQEIGHATAEVSLPADDARYVPFELNKEIPLSLTKFIELDLKKE